MRILLDECVDGRFAPEIVGHAVQTVPRRGWAGVPNGELLRLAQEEFDALVTVDRSLPSQQDLTRYRIAVVVLRPRSNRLADLKPLVPALLAAIVNCRVGEATFVTP